MQCNRANWNSRTACVVKWSVQPRVRAVQSHAATCLIRQLTSTETGTSTGHRPNVVNYYYIRLTVTSRCPGLPRVSRYQKGKTSLDFTGARDSEWQWHQLGHMKVCTSLQTGNHANAPSISSLQAGCPSCRPTNSVKALNKTRNYRIVETDLIASMTTSISCADEPTRRHRAV